MPHQAGRVSLAELVQAELERLNAVPRRGAMSGPLRALEDAGYAVALDPPIACHVGDSAGRIVANLERTAIIQYLDGSREAVGIDRVYVGPEDIRFVAAVPARNEHLSSARGRANALAAKQKPTHCAHCGGPIPPSKGPGQVRYYCRDLCQQRAAHLRAAERRPKPELGLPPVAAEAG